MEIFNSELVVESLEKDTLKNRLATLEMVIKIFSDITRSAVRSLEQSEGRLLIAERLHLFGSIAISHLQELHMTTTEEEIKTLTAIVLLRLGNTSGIRWLLKVIQIGKSEYVCLCARQLANARVREAGEVIISQLHSLNFYDEQLLICLLKALQILEIEIPEELSASLAFAMISRLQLVDLDDLSSIINLLDILLILRQDMPVELYMRFSKINSLNNIIKKFKRNLSST
ncbi:MAG: hypothetical protein K8I82_06005 [Anaerolineae bacterium]|nr:hypothetical protein [Anaerolineae bacterium]